MTASYSTSAFRRSAALYTIGRVFNALLSFFVFVWIARFLPERHYAYYIAAFACLELGLVFCGFGMEWVTAVHVPKIRLQGSANILRRFVWSCAAIQGLLLLAGSIVFYANADRLAPWLDLEGAESAFRIYALVMFVEGTSRVFRDQLLSCLLLQGAAQLSQTARNLAMLAFALSLAAHADWRTAETLAFVELGASVFSLALAALFLQRHLAGVVDDGGEHHSPPPWRELLRAARNAWFSNLANLSWGGQAVILIATRMAGAEATAVLGFTRNLSEQVRRYMPMEFLFGIVRTLLFARFAKDGDRYRLGLRAGLMYRANLLFLLPLLALAVTHGERICALLSGDRYAAGHWLLVGWLTVLLFWAHHRLSDLLAHAIARSDLTSRSSLLLLPTPLLVALAAHYQVWLAMFAALACAELSYSAIVLGKVDYYSPNWSALAKLALAAAVAALLLSLPSLAFGGPVGLLFLCALSFASLAGIALLTKAWSLEERALLAPTHCIETTTP